MTNRLADLQVRPDDREILERRVLAVGEDERSSLPMPAQIGLLLIRNPELQQTKFPGVEIHSAIAAELGIDTEDEDAVTLVRDGLLALKREGSLWIERSDPSVAEQGSDGNDTARPTSSLRPVLSPKVQHLLEGTVEMAWDKFPTEGS